MPTSDGESALNCYLFVSQCWRGNSNATGYQDDPHPNPCKAFQRCLPGVSTLLNCGHTVKAWGVREHHGLMLILEILHDPQYTIVPSFPKYRVLRVMQDCKSAPCPPALRFPLDSAYKLQTLVRGPLLEAQGRSKQVI